jgi:hypothetical protein
MKKTFIILVGLFSSLLAFSQNTAVDQLFNRYADKDGYTTVTVSKSMFSLFASESESKDEFSQAIKGLESIRILAPDSVTAARSKINFYNEISKSLPLTQYEELMSVKEKDQVFKMLIRKKGAVITEFLMIGGGKNNVLICLTGNINLKSIKKLSKAMDIEGMENIDKLESK